MIIKSSILIPRSPQLKDVDQTITGFLSELLESTERGDGALYDFMCRFFADRQKGNGYYTPLDGGDGGSIQIYDF